MGSMGRLQVLKGGINMDLNSSVLVTGTINLLNDLITAFTVISTLIATVMGIYYLARKSSCEEQEGKMLTRR